MSGTSYSQTQSAIQAAVAEWVRENDKDSDDSYVYVNDFDDDTAIYGYGGQLFQVGYKFDGKGNASVDGDPVPVRPVTTYQAVPDEQKGLRSFETRGVPSAMGQPRIEVRSEPLTYDRHNNQHSYFRDMVLSQTRDNSESRLRIERHQTEMRVERERFERRAAQRLHDGGFETRVNPNTTQGTGGYFDVPLWLNQYFATAPRAVRVLADMIPTFAIPQGAHSINLPRITTGNASGPQQDNTADPDTDVVDAGVTATVTTLSGQGDVAIQLLEQSPAGAHLDWAFFKDLTEAYDAELESQLIYGSGIGESISGLGSVIAGAGGSVVTDNTSPGGTTAGTVLWTDIAKLIGKVGDARSLPPQVVLMRTARWTWLGQEGDTQSRPLVTPGDAPQAGDGAPVDGQYPVGAAYGFPLFVDDAIPTTISTNQDIVVACRPSDLILFEGTPRTTVGLEVLSGTLSARIQLRNYTAALTGRYPSGVGIVTGALLAADSGY